MNFVSFFVLVLYDVITKKAANTMFEYLRLI